MSGLWSETKYTDEQYSENAGAVTYVEEGMSLHRTGKTYLESHQRADGRDPGFGSYETQICGRVIQVWNPEIYLANQENSHFFREGTEVLYFDFIKGKIPQFVTNV